MKMAESSPKGKDTVEKGEIARYEQCLLFPVFSKDLYCKHVKTRAFFFWKGLKTLSQTAPGFYSPDEEEFRKHCEKTSKC